MTYLKYYEPKYEGNAEISYNLNGETKSVKLNRFRGHTIQFGEEQYKNADIKLVNGDIACNMHYTGEITEQTEKQKLIVEKTYSSSDGKWTPGSLIKVTINVKNSVPLRSYVINDIIPTCARYSYTNTTSSHDRSGQRVNLYMYDRSAATYYIRLVNEGD